MGLSAVACNAEPANVVRAADFRKPRLDVLIWSPPCHHNSATVATGKQTLQNQIQKVKMPERYDEA
jgi:hypothetical protein